MIDDTRCGHRGAGKSSRAGMMYDVSRCSIKLNTLIPTGDALESVAHVRREMAAHGIPGHNPHGASKMMEDDFAIFQSGAI